MALTMPGSREPLRLSPVTALNWTADGYALACAWIYGGVSVWSVYGSLLMSTVSEDTFVHASDGVMNAAGDAYFQGVQDLFWTPESFDLFLLPAPQFVKESVTDIYALPFCKSSILASHTWNNGRNVCLLGSDRLLLYEGLTPDVSPISIDPVNWQTIHIPTTYLVENWPVKVAHWYLAQLTCGRLYLLI